MNKKYSDKTKEKIIEQYLAGVSVSDLVNIFNVSRTTVYYICVILDLYSRKVVAHRVSLSNST